MVLTLMLWNAHLITKSVIALHCIFFLCHYKYVSVSLYLPTPRPKEKIIFFIPCIWIYFLLLHDLYVCSHSRSMCMLNVFESERLFLCDWFMNKNISFKLLWISVFAFKWYDAYLYRMQWSCNVFHPSVSPVFL